MELKSDSESICILLTLLLPYHWIHWIKKNDYLRDVLGAWRSFMEAIETLHEEGISVGVTGEMRHTSIFASSVTQSGNSIAFIPNLADSSPSMSIKLPHKASRGNGLYWLVAICPFLTIPSIGVSAILRGPASLGFFSSKRAGRKKRVIKPSKAKVKSISSNEVGFGVGNNVLLIDHYRSDP